MRDFRLVFSQRFGMTEEFGEGTRKKADSSRRGGSATEGRKAERQASPKARESEKSGGDAEGEHASLRDQHQKAIDQVESEKLELQNRCKKQDNTLKVIIRKFKKAQDVAQTRKGVIQRQSEQIHQLESDATAFEQKTQSLRDEMANLETQLEQEKEAHERTRIENKRLSDELLSVSKNCSKLKVACRQRNKEVTLLRTENAKLEQMIESQQTMSKQNQELVEKNESLLHFRLKTKSRPCFLQNSNNTSKSYPSIVTRHSAYTECCRALKMHNKTLQHSCRR